VIAGGGLVLMRPSPNGDEPAYILEAISIARDGDVDLANQYDDPQLVAAVYGNPSLSPQAFRFPGGHGLQSVHGPGLPLLLAPVAAVSTNPRWMRYEMVVIAALAAVLLMALLQRIPVARPWHRWAAWLAVVASAPFLVYASALYPEIPAAAAVLGAVLLLARSRPTPAALVGASLLAAALPWLNVRFLPLTLAIALVALWRARGSARGVIAVVAPLAVSGVVFALAFQHWYGSWLPTAQYALSDSPRTLPGFYRGLVGNLLDPRSGWLPVAPLHVAGLVAIGVAVVRLGRPALLAALAAAVYLLVVAGSGLGFSGSSFPGRELVVVLPLVALPLALLLGTRRWALGACAVLAVVSLWATARTVHEDGHWPPAPHYDALWPDTAQGIPAAVTWTGRAPATTPALPASAYTTVVPLRAVRPAGGTVAHIAVADAHGRVLAQQDVAARALPPAIGWRRFFLSFHTSHPTRMTLTVRTVGPAVAAGTAAIASAPDQTAAGVTGFPDLWLTLVWLGGMVLVGVGCRRAVKLPITR
jgi:hypothetical protein